MNQKTTYVLLLLTAISLFVAPHVARIEKIIPTLPFVPFLVLGIWIIAVIKNLKNPDAN